MHRGQEEADEHTDDGDDDEQFDERETRSRAEICRAMAGEKRSTHEITSF
jgi:hypothetical protein